eukprot:2497990-Amphidinium_carterae.1
MESEQPSPQTTQQRNSRRKRLVALAAVAEFPKFALMLSMADATGRDVAFATVYCKAHQEAAHQQPARAHESMLRGCCSVN